MKVTFAIVSFLFLSRFVEITHSVKRQCVAESDHKGNLHFMYTPFVYNILLKIALRKALSSPLRVPEKIAYYGDTRDTAALSCHHIKRARPTAASGVYWLKLKSNPKAPFQVYCDQVTDRGGWTLVYSYGFTYYRSFSSGSNAVSPRPNWRVSYNNVPISVKPPLQEYGLGAMDFKKWKEIGSEVMIKSNINHWIACKPNKGSLVQWRAGSLVCRNLKNMLSTCRGRFPNKLVINSYGPSFYRSSYFYHFEGSTSRDWPVHDPCGGTGTRQKKGVKNPGGNLFIR